MFRPSRCIALLLVVGLGLVLSHAQVAPDLGAGVSVEDVIQAYGWPKGRSATSDREIWLYDDFQVLFLQGRLVQVSPLPHAKNKPLPPLPTPKRTAPAPNPAPGGAVPPRATPRPAVAPMARPPASPAPSGPRALPAGSATTFPLAPLSVQRPPSSLPAAAQTTPADSTGPAAGSADYVALPSTTDRPQPFANVLSLVLNHAWVPVVVVGVLAALGFAVRANRRGRERAPGKAPAEKPAASARPKTFEQHVAERLANAGPRYASSTRSAPLPVTTSVVEPTPELLRQVEWRRFEQWVARFHGETGARVECSAIGADGAVDMKLYRAGSKQPDSLVRCKATGGRLVEVDELRAFYIAMAVERIREAVFITTGDFTMEAAAFAVQHELRTINGREFLAMFEQLPASTRAAILQEITAGDYTTPTCPACDVKAVPRQWKHGGAKFWACPQCSWTLNVRAEE